MSSWPSVWRVATEKKHHVPPRPVLTPVPVSPSRTTSPSVYLVSSGYTFPWPPLPWLTGAALILVCRLLVCEGVGPEEYCR